MTKVKCGLIQMSLKASTDETPEAIRDAMLSAHEPFIAEAAAAGVQVLCFQEVFTQPYFCPSQDAKWYAAAEAIPDGHTTRLMQEMAKKHGMVIVVPIYEEEIHRRLLQRCGGDRCRWQLSRQVPQDAHSPSGGVLGEVLLQARQFRLAGFRNCLL